MPPIHAVIFDMDGTLIDTLDDLTRSIGAAIEAEGLPAPTRDQVRQRVGHGTRALAERCLPPEKHHRVYAVLAAFRAHYAEHLVDRTRLFPGVAGLLDALEGRKLRMAVLSNKPHHPTVALADRMLRDWPWVQVRGWQEGVPAKPDPAALLPSLEALGEPPERCAMVGDSEADMGVARAGGLLAVGVTWGFRSAEELRAAGAEIVVDTAEELQRVLLGQ